jgi:hypothetical protein
MLAETLLCFAFQWEDIAVHGFHWGRGCWVMLLLGFAFIGEGVVNDKPWRRRSSALLSLGGKS